MKAPDKIYVPLTINLLTKRQVLRLDATDVKPISFANENIEYIRKEAILEWANGMMDCFAPGGDCSQTLQMVIKHIESL